MTFRRLVFFPIALSLLGGCDFFQQEAPTHQKPKIQAEKPGLKTQDIKQLVNYVSLNGYELFSKAAIEAENLEQSIALLLRNPKPETFEAAKKQWRSAYSSYLMTQPYYYLPIKDPIEWVQKGIAYKNLAANIDSYPIEGGYIDYLKGYPFSGLVNDLAIEINEANLIEQHGLADPSYASLGFHVLEFLLWGEEGQRQVSDYYPQKNQQETYTADSVSLEKSQSSSYKIQNHLRRRAMLKLVSQKLVKDINHVKQRWELSTGFYAVTLMDSLPERALAATLQSSQHLLEREILAQRLRESSSPFSQTTADDVRAIVAGMLDLYDLGSNDESSTEEDTSKAARTGFLLSTNEELANVWQKETATLIGFIDAWQKSRTQDDKTRVTEQSIQVLQLIYKIAKEFNVLLKKPKTKDQLEDG